VKPDSPVCRDAREVERAPWGGLNTAVTREEAATKKQIGARRRSKRELNERHRTIFSRTRSGGNGLRGMVVLNERRRARNAILVIKRIP